MMTATFCSPFGEPEFVLLTVGEVLVLQPTRAMISEKTTEIHAHNQTVFDQMMDLFETHSMTPKVTEISHEDFKTKTCDSQAVVRTGECTPYANVILKSGVVF